jgi:hypothetical protein
VFVQLAVSGHFEEVDRAAQAIRKLGRLRRGTGEGYYSALTQQLAQTWISLENSNQLESSKVPLKNLDEGLLAGLELAVLAAAVRDHANMGAGRDHAPGQLEWDVIHARRDSAKLALAEVLSGEHPPAFAFRTALALGSDMGESPEELQPLIKRYIELHPNASGGHSVLCVHMTPHQSGAAGEGGAYIAAVGALLPQTSSDLLYLRATHTLVDRFGHDIASPQKSGLSLSRLLQSVDRLLESEDLSKSEVLFLMELASRYSQPDVQARLGKYFLTKFQVIDSATTVEPFLLRARAEMEKD